MSTAKITAADVNKLRQITGAGMMDCKKALAEAEGDFKKQSITFVRKVKRWLQTVLIVKRKKAISSLKQTLKEQKAI